jgi:hypothetical protein
MIPKKWDLLRLKVSLRRNGKLAPEERAALRDKCAVKQIDARYRLARCYSIYECFDFYQYFSLNLIGSYIKARI